MTFNLTACGSDPEPQETAPLPPLVEEIVNYPDRAFGGTVPLWVQDLRRGDINRAGEEHEDKVLFAVMNHGENLDVLKFWANKFEINSTVANQLSTFFNEQAAVITDVDEDEVEKTAEVFSSVASKVTYYGLRKDKEYWLQVRDLETSEVEYEYYVLYTMDEELWDDTLEDIIKGIPDENKLLVQPILEKARDEDFFSGYNG